MKADAPPYPALSAPARVVGGVAFGGRGELSAS